MCTRYRRVYSGLKDADSVQVVWKLGFHLYQGLSKMHDGIASRISRDYRVNDGTGTQTTGLIPC